MVKTGFSRPVFVFAPRTIRTLRNSPNRPRPAQAPPHVIRRTVLRAIHRGIHRKSAPQSSVQSTVKSAAQSSVQSAPRAAPCTVLRTILRAIRAPRSPLPSHPCNRPPHRNPSAPRLR